MSKMMVISTETMRKMAAFIQGAMPIVKAAAERDAQLDSVIPGVVDELVRQDHLSVHMKEAKAKEFKDNPVKMAEALQTLAKSANVRKPVGGPDGDGQPQTEKSANDVFVESLLGTGASQ